MVSVVTVVRNGIKTIEQTILSVINQDYHDFEYIIIDGVSTDGTLEILNKYSDKISKIISEPDVGIYDAMNKGIALANGDWVYFLGCDDVLYESSTLSRIFSHYPQDADVLYGNVKYLHSTKIFDGEFDYAKLCTKSPCHQAIFYKKSLFAIYGVFDLRYITTADYVMHVKTFCSGAHWHYIDQIIAVYNETGASFTCKDKDYLSDNFKIRYDNFSPFVTNFVLSRIFYSSFWRFCISHKLSVSLNYFCKVNKRIGSLNLVGYFFKSILKK